MCVAGLWPGRAERVQPPCNPAQLRFQIQLQLRLQALQLEVDSLSCQRLRCFTPSGYLTKVRKRFPTQEQLFDTPALAPPLLKQGQSCSLRMRQLAFVAIPYRRILT